VDVVSLWFPSFINLFFLGGLGGLGGSKIDFAIVLPIVNEGRFWRQWRV